MSGPDRSPPPRPAVVLAVVAIGTFMSALGTSLVNVAVPTIRRDLGADMGGASFILAAYTLAVSALLLPMGRLGDLWGKRRVYVAGFVIFGLGAGACAIAPTLGLLIAARAVQGAGAAMLMSTGPALTTAAFPPAERGRALGLQATATYLGLTIGPPLGGHMAHAFGWHALFWVHLPIALGGAILSRALLHPGPIPIDAPFPGKSSLLFGLSLTALLVALTRMERWGATSPAVMGLGALGIALFLGFSRSESASATPLVPRGMLRDRAIVAGLAAAFLHYATTFLFGFLLPFYLQGPRGLDAAEAGTWMTVQPAVMAMSTGASGWLSDKVGTRIPAVTGMILITAGMLRLALVDPGASAWSVLVALGAMGLGSGLFIAPNNSGVMGLAPRGQQGVAAALLAEARNLGMLCGVAAAGGVFAALGGGRPDAVEASAFFPALRGTIALGAALAVIAALLSAGRPQERAEVDARSG
ncbi:MAG: MFS transporter [Byssovorax sp.]